MKKILLILILGIFLVSLASSEVVQTLGTYRKGDCIDLVQTCSNCTYNNITTIIRDSQNTTIYIINDTMNRHDTYYNFSFCNTTELGEYIVNGFGNPNGDKTIWSYNLFITPSGLSLSTADSILYIFLSIAVFLMFGISLYFNITLPSGNVKNDVNEIIKVSRVKYLKFMLILVTYPLFLWLLNILVAMSNNFSALSQFFGFFSFLFDVLTKLGLPLFIFIFVVTLFNVIKDSNIKNMIKKFGKY